MRDAVARETGALTTREVTYSRRCDAAQDELYRTETFGPIVGVAEFAALDEAVELANGHGYGLSAAVYTRYAANALRFR